MGVPWEFNYAPGLKKGLANATHLNDRKTHLLLSWPLESMDPWTHGISEAS